MNWTQDQLDARNREILGTDFATKPNPQADEICADFKEKSTEAQIEAECTKVLEQDGWRALRTDPVSDRGRGRGFGEIGMADYLYLRYDFVRQNAAVGGLGDIGFGGLVDKETLTTLHAYADVMWIEFKRPGEKAKKHQQAWHAKERARGALTLIAGEDFPASVAGFKEWYAASGLCRNRKAVEA